MFIVPFKHPGGHSHESLIHTIKIMLQSLANCRSSYVICIGSNDFPLLRCERVIKEMPNMCQGSRDIQIEPYI